MSSSETAGYFVPLEEAHETERLISYHRFLKEQLGGLFPEQRSLEGVSSILDIACGPGGWALDVAERYPHIEVVGVDVSPSRVAYAQEQARQRKISNATFQVMDALEALTFPPASFSLVNARLLQGFMPTTQWLPFLASCTKIVRPGGQIRLTECENTLTNAPSLERLSLLHTQSYQRVDYSFSPTGTAVGVTMALAAFLRQAGLHSVEQHVAAIDFSTGSLAHEYMEVFFALLLPLVLPFLVTQGVVGEEEGSQLIAQALEEIRAEHFYGIWYYRTVWGTVS